MWIELCMLVLLPSLLNEGFVLLCCGTLDTSFVCLAQLPLLLAWHWSIDPFTTWASWWATCLWGEERGREEAYAG
eukprot:jgi/Botrbrau1/15189/Bobra.0149s0054.1